MIKGVQRGATLILNPGSALAETKVARSVMSARREGSFAEDVEELGTVDGDGVQLLGSFEQLGLEGGAAPCLVDIPSEGDDLVDGHTPDGVGNVDGEE